MKYSSLRTLLTVLPNGKLSAPWSISEGCFRPRFLTKSRLAFTIFNSLLLGLLLIHFAASHFYEPISDQPPNMVFPALFATGILPLIEKKIFILFFSVLLIVHIMFLVVGVEIYCKIRGAFVSEKSEIANVDKVQAIHSRLGLFFQVRNMETITSKLNCIFSGDLLCSLLSSSSAK